MTEAIKNYLLEIRPTAMALTLLLVGLIVAFFLKYHREMAPRMGTLEWIRNYERPRFTLDGVRHPMERKDLMPLIILMAVYAVAAFANLGSTDAPQSFYTFTEEKDVVELAEDHQLCDVLHRPVPRGVRRILLRQRQQLAPAPER